VHNGVPGKGMPLMRQLGTASILGIVKYLRTLQSASDPAAEGYINAFDLKKLNFAVGGQAGRPDQGVSHVVRN